MGTPGPLFPLNAWLLPAASSRGFSGVWGVLVSCQASCSASGRAKVESLSQGPHRGTPTDCLSDGGRSMQKGNDAWKSSSSSGEDERPWGVVKSKDSGLLKLPAVSRISALLPGNIGNFPLSQCTHWSTRNDLPMSWIFSSKNNHVNVQEC